MAEYTLNFDDIPLNCDEIRGNSSEHNDGFLGTLCVFYNASPFSDFAPYRLIIDGKFYPSVEHYIQLQMFQSFGLFQLVNKLGAIVDATEFRKAVRQSLKYMSKSDIFSDKMFQDWRDKNVEKMLRKSNHAKYEQNLTVREQLLQTGERILIFTSKNDSILGVGMSESEFFKWIETENVTLEDLLNFFTDDQLRPKELGKNLLGIVLMEIRAYFDGKQSVITEWKHKIKKNHKLPDMSLPQLNLVPSEKDLDTQNVQMDTNAQINEKTKDDENCATVKPSERTVTVLKDDKIILYHKIGGTPKVISEISDKEMPKDKEPNLPKITAENVEINSTVEVKQTALERLKALRFEKPTINPFTTPVTSSSLQHVNNSSVPSTSNVDKLNELQRLERFNPIRKKGSPAKRRCQPCVVGSGDLYDLEPGEIPGSNYKPPPPIPFRRTTEYPGIPSLIDLPFIESFNPCPKIDVSKNVDGSKSSWKPSDNPLKDLLQRAQDTLTKLEASGVNTSAVVNEQNSVFPPFPATSSKLTKNTGKKAKKERKLGRQYKVRFTNDTAMLRHHANRWVKGGRLSTTGRFEEVDELNSDDDDDSDEEQQQHNIEEAKIIKLLEETEEACAKKHYESHVIYEDTHQYQEYLKWYSETHNEPMPGAFDDEKQIQQRKWYQFYRTAVQLVDLPQDTLDDNDSPSSSCVEYSTNDSNCQDFNGLFYGQTYDTLVQQWRWKQIHQWKPEIGKSLREEDPYRWSNGISFGSEPVSYQKQEESLSNTS